MDRQTPKELVEIGLPETLWWPEKDYGAYGKLEDGKGDGPAFELWQHHQKWLELTPRRTVCIQAGGCCGMYPIFYSLHFDKVLTCEATKENFKYLNTNASNHKNIITENLALTNHNQPLRMKSTDTRNVGTHTVDPDGNEVVQSTTIDMLVEKYNLQDVALIHLDIEGSEGPAIEGAIKTIERFYPTIIAEDTSSALRRHLPQRGYEMQPHHDKVWVKKV